jgi:hypothetical protein
MINNFTNINKTNNYTSPQSTHKKKRENKPTTNVDRYPDPGLGQQKMWQG